MCAISDFSCKSCERHGNLIFQGPNATNSDGSPPEFPVSTCATSTAERRPPFPPAFSSLVAPRGEGMEGAALSPSRRMERRERISKTALLVGRMPKWEGWISKTHWWRYSMCLGMPMTTQFQWPVESLGISPLLPTRKGSIPTHANQTFYGKFQVSPARDLYIT